MSDQAARGHSAVSPRGLSTADLNWVEHVQERAMQSPTSSHQARYSGCKTPNHSTCHGRHQTAMMSRLPALLLLGKLSSVCRRAPSQHVCKTEMYR